MPIGTESGSARASMPRAIKSRRICSLCTNAWSQRGSIQRYKQNRKQHPAYPRREGVTCCARPHALQLRLRLGEREPVEEFQSAPRCEPSQHCRNDELVTHLHCVIEVLSAHVPRATKRRSLRSAHAVPAHTGAPGRYQESVGREPYRASVPRARSARCVACFRSSLHYGNRSDVSTLKKLFGQTAQQHQAGTSENSSRTKNSMLDRFSRHAQGSA